MVDRFLAKYMHVTAGSFDFKERVQLENNLQRLILLTFAAKSRNSIRTVKPHCMESFAGISPWSQDSSCI